MNTIHFPTHHIGAYTVTAISDGYIAGNVNFLSNITPENARQIQHDAGISQAGDIHINCYLIQGCDKTILIDTGAGGIKNWGGETYRSLSPISDQSR